MGQEGDSDEEGAGGFELGIGDVVRILLAHLRLILGLTLLSGGLAAAVAFSLPNRYEGVATVQIDPRAKKIVNFEGVLADLKADAATIDSEVEIIKSKTIAVKVIDQLNLRQDPEFAAPPQWRQIATKLGVMAPSEPPEARGPVIDDEITRKSRDNWSVWFGLESGLQVPERDEVARVFESRLKVARVRSSHLIEIRFSSASSVRAAEIVNAIAEAYIRSQIEAKSRATEVAGDLLDDRVKGLREKVGVAEREVERFKADNNIFNSDGSLLVERQLTREMEALVAARNQTGEARARHEAARRMMLEGEGSDAIADVLQNNTVRLLRDELTKALRREAELGTKYGARHPEMQRIAADIAKAQSELASEIGKITRNLKTELTVAADREKQHEARIENIKQQINSAKDQQWKLRELEREATASKQMLEVLLQRNKQTEETLGLQLPDARIVASSDVPLYPSSPKRKLIVFGAIGAGLVLGIALAFLIELMSAGFTRPEQLEQMLKIAHLSSLPIVAGSRRGADRLRLYRQMLADQRGMYAEAVRAMRHEIDRSRRRDAGAVVLITSSVAGEGKSVTASNLALQYAITGHRTLLIDADLRKREITRTLSLGRRPGLLEVLAKGQPLDQAVVRDATSGLFVLPASAEPDIRYTASELLDSDRMQRVIGALRRQYDTIIVDAPPLLPVLDARVLAQQADSIVMVTGWRRTPRSQVRRALKLISGQSRKIVGAVLSQVAPEILARSMGYAGTQGYRELPQLPLSKAA